MDLIFIAVNGGLLLITLIGGVIILRASTRHTYNMGNNPVQHQLRLTIMRTLLLLIFVGLAATLFNLLYPELLK